MNVSVPRQVDVVLHLPALGNDVASPVNRGNHHDGANDGADHYIKR